MITIAASLIGPTTPQSVMVVVSGTTAGQVVTITGRSASGFEWNVSGSPYTSTGEQIVLIDTRSPINVPIAYTATVVGVSYQTPLLTVTAPGDIAFQSLDGTTTVVPAALLDGDFPLAPVPRATQFEIAGRRRPVVRFDVALDGGSEFAVLTDVAQSKPLSDLLAVGAPIVYRSSGIRDMPLSEIIHVGDVSSVSHQDDYSRIWTLAFTFVEDPDPTLPMQYRTWNQFDGTYAAATWDAFDAEWAGQTWNAFDAEDWSTR